MFPLPPLYLPWSDGTRCHYGSFFFFKQFIILFILIVLGLHSCLSASCSFRKRAFQCSGFSCCGARTLGYSGLSSCSMWAQWWWHMGLVAPQHVESSLTENPTCIPALAGGFLATVPWGKADLSFWTLSFKSVSSSPCSPSSRGSLVPLRFLRLEWYHLHVWGCWYFSQHLYLNVKKKTEIWFVKKKKIWISSALPLCLL